MILDSLKLKIKAPRFFETFVAICQSLQWIISTDMTLQKHISEKLKILFKKRFLPTCVFGQWLTCVRVCLVKQRVSFVLLLSGNMENRTLSM